MFEKFRLKKLSKVVQTVVTQFFEQVTKKDYLATFSKINFLNIENVALLYEKNKKIVINKSDEVLKMAFEEKLKEIRAKKAAQKSDIFWNGTRTKRFSDAEIRRIVEYRYFAYIDLYTYSLITGRKFTDVEMAAMIYPPRNNTPLDFDAVDRIARTVRPKAIELFERTNPRLLL